MTPDPDLDVRTELTNMRRASRLSALWVFVLLSMLFRDLHEFANPEFVEQLLSQTVPDGLLFIAGIIIAMPIIMVPLNHLLPPVWSRRANLLVVLIFAVSMIANPPGDLDDYWFTALEVLGLAAVAWLAWRWRPEFTPPIPDTGRPNRRTAHPGS